MKIRLIHTTSYTFSDNVFIEPHILKFYPRNNLRQAVSKFELKMEPDPSGHYDFIDAENNEARMVWFNGEYKSMNIKAFSVIEFQKETHLDFLIYPFEFNSLPIKYPFELGLNKYLTIPEKQPQADQLAINLFDTFEHSIFNFIIQVTEYIHELIKTISRETGIPQKPDETLKMKTGSCRDSAVLMIYLLRKIGLAARFVSGYKYNMGLEEDHELHAWVEVFIPGAGWLGADPTYGLLANNDHIAVCSSFLPSNTMPVSGTFRGKADSDLKSNVHISLLSEE